jgi:hypothetical protein
MAILLMTSANSGDESLIKAKQTKRMTGYYLATMRK